MGRSPANCSRPTAADTSVPRCRTAGHREVPLLYRVDYVIGVMLLGGLLGVAYGKWRRPHNLSVVANDFYLAICVAVVGSVVANAVTILHGPTPEWAIAGVVCSSVSNLLLGALFGIATQIASPWD